VLCVMAVGGLAWHDLWAKGAAGQDRTALSCSGMRDQPQPMSSQGPSGAPHLIGKVWREEREVCLIE
jgi:hypothetical protein